MRILLKIIVISITVIVGSIVVVFIRDVTGSKPGSFGIGGILGLVAAFATYYAAKGIWKYNPKDAKGGPNSDENLDKTL